MKTLRFVLLVVLCVALTAAVGNAKKASRAFDPDKAEMHKSFRYQVPEVPLDLSNIPRAAAQGTTYLGRWSFDSGGVCVDQGWVGVDLSAQLANFWHVDDFAGLGGGDFGNLLPVQGAKSMWLGTRPNPGDPIVCGYITAPGYGENWDQSLVSDCFTVTGDVTVTFVASWDIEPAYDGTWLEYSLCDDDWESIDTPVNAEWGGKYAGFETARADTAVVVAASHSGSIRFRFHFYSDIAASDQDGYYNTDGAIILDSLSVEDDGGQFSYEDFESANVGDQNAGDWTSELSPAYGNFSGIFPGTALVQEDPCFQNYTCTWGFFNGSPYDYACGGFPSQPAVPYGNARGQYLANQIWSPVIPWGGSGSIAEIQFNVYRDVPVDPLVFYIWSYRDWHGTCPGPWEFDFGVYYGDDKDWFPQIFSFAEFVDPGATAIQLAIGAWDLCDAWCGIVGTGLCHSHAPLIDDVEIYRVATAGPIWAVNDFDIFQDNFATDGTVTGTVRCDMSNSILPRPSLGVLPGDSAVVTANDPEWGLAGDSYTSFGPAVYMFARVDPLQPAKTGEALVEDFFRWPVVDSLLDTNGDMWYMIRCDTSFQAIGRVDEVPDQYCVDVNDNLLTPGDTLWFFFGGQSADVGGSWSYYYHQPKVTESLGVGGVFHTSDINVAIFNAEEMTCLPAAGLDPTHDILFVDDFSGRAHQPFWDWAFKFLNIYDEVDRYDVRNPDSGVGNGLGGRVVNVFQQLIPYYKKIIWYSGNLRDALISDGFESNDRSDDFYVLYNFLDQSPSDPGLWVTGDFNANEWFSLTTPTAVSMRNVYMNFGLLTSDHKTLGLPISPLVVGAGGGHFQGLAGPDTLVAYGGCPLINQFDVLQQTGSSVVEEAYNDNPAWPAALSQQTANSGGGTARVLLEGYGYGYIRDDRPAGILDRAIHLQHALNFLGNITDEPTGVDPTAYRYSLSQNYPNPFNPTTTIKYTLKEPASVTLRIYNAAGQLIRTLVDDTKTPGEVHTATWDGRNNAGQSVSSGVYFYKLVAGDFVQTKKMVLLK